MKVYVDKDDKDFLDACLSECRVYEYVADELQYSDRLKLVNLSDYTKQVINNTFDKINSQYAKRLSAFMGTKISVSTAITKLDEVLDTILKDYQK